VLGTLVRLRERERSTRNEPLRASLSPDGRWVLTTWGANVRLWDLEHLKPDDKPTHHLNLNLAPTNPVTAVAIAADGRRALLGFKTDEPAGKNKKPRDVFAVAVWTPGSTDEPELLEGHKDEVTCLALSARGNFALSGSNDRTVRYWNLETGALVHPPLNHGDLVSCVAFSPDGRYALSGGRDKTIVLWDLESGKRVASATEHETLVSCVAFSRDGKFAVSGSHDRKICLYEVQNLKKIGTFPGHTAAVRCLSFSPEGGLFLSGGEDETVRLWRPPQRENIECFQEHKRGVVDVTVLPGGRYALSISSDNTIQRWDLAPTREP
jgi:WD40 repeat protein